MLPEILEAIRLHEETVEIGGQTLVVRELSNVAEMGSSVGPDEKNEDGTTKSDQDAFYHLMVACVFDQQGKKALTVEDIPILKESSRVRLAPLVAAVQRVNGFDVVGDAKKSEPAPASVSSTV